MNREAGAVENVIPPVHPTYGTLDHLLATIKADIEQGYEVRIGLQGAMAWFGHQYGQQRARSEPAK